MIKTNIRLAYSLWMCSLLSNSVSGGGECLVWTQLPGTPPEPRFSHQMAFDSRRNVTVLFGGSKAEFPHALSDTWEWAGSMWVKRSVPGPLARYAHAMAFDSTRGVTVLFGGQAVLWTFPFNDTWEWDGKDWRLHSYEGPAARSEHHLAFDSARNVTVLYGGRTVVGPTFDTWEWDGNAWSLLNEAGPDGCCGAMAFDELRGLVVLYLPGASGHPGKTWTWDGDLWTLVDSQGPSAGADQQMVFDQHRNILVMFGGSSDQGVTWEWDGVNWQAGAALGPLYRSKHGMVFDSQADRTVLFGGVSGGFPDDDTWEYDGHHWMLRNDWPSRELDSEMIYDSARHITVLAGSRPFSDTLETWEWDGQVWHQREANGPTARAKSAMGFDEYRGYSLMFGGATSAGDINETLSWDGLQWSLLSVAGPVGREGHAMAFSDTGVVLFGGFLAPKGIVLDGTWAWEGNQWRYRTRVSDLVPPARYEHAMAFDAQRRLTVMYGGLSEDQTTPMGDTWEWNGYDCLFVADSGPSPRAFHTMTYDTDRMRVVLFGGRGGDPSPNEHPFKGDLWEWDGAVWVERKIAGTGPSGIAHIVYDEKANAIILQGTIAYLENPRELWTVEYRPLAQDADSDCNLDLREISLFQRCIGRDSVECSVLNSDEDPVVCLFDLATLVDQMAGPY